VEFQVKEKSNVILSTVDLTPNWGSAFPAEKILHSGRPGFFSKKPGLWGWDEFSAKISF
jgi:hypothetical protein